MKRNAEMLAHNPLSIAKARLEWGGMRWTPKVERKRQRIALEAELREAEHTIERAANEAASAIEEKVKAAKLAAVEAWSNVAGNLKAKLAFLRGRK